MLLLHLRTKDNYEASCRPLPLKALAKRYDVDVDLIREDTPRVRSF